jgi:hypothetical protein
LHCIIQLLNDVAPVSHEPVFSRFLAFFLFFFLKCQSTAKSGTVNTLSRLVPSKGYQAARRNEHVTATTEAAYRLPDPPKVQIMSAFRINITSLYVSLGNCRQTPDKKKPDWSSKAGCSSNRTGRETLQRPVCLAIGIGQATPCRCRHRGPTLSSDHVEGPRSVPETVRRYR